jgi:hypothetical protein
LNTVPYFLLGMPIPFKGICTIHPLTIEQRITFEEKYLGSIFLPYMIAEETVKEKYPDIELFSLILSDEVLLPLFCESLKVFCKAEKFHFDSGGDKLLIDENKTAMDSSSFKEFCKIIRDWNCISPQKPEVEPVFKTEEGRKQWLKLKELRAKNAKIEDDFLSTMINVVQFGGTSYIDESAIKKWTLWKIANAYHAIINSREYEHAFNAYLQGGKKDLVKQHWTERLKPNLKIK